jgi:hypothetical protein
MQFPIIPRSFHLTAILASQSLRFTLLTSLPAAIAFGVDHISLETKGAHSARPVNRRRFPVAIRAVWPTRVQGSFPCSCYECRHEEVKSTSFLASRLDLHWLEEDKMGSGCKAIRRDQRFNLICFRISDNAGKLIAKVLAGQLANDLGT